MKKTVDNSVEEQVAGPSTSSLCQNINKKLPHHKQHKLCETRPPYRQGRKLTAVKVYTINDESQHLYISGVPKLDLKKELEKRLSRYGIIKKFHLVPDYPNEQFTETFHLQYARIQNARIAKHFVDGLNFFGGNLHVFYVPELESKTETKQKLLQRRRDVETRLKKYSKEEQSEMK